ncbi:hypothetical protein [Flavobacterium adhaerens]|uniref:hypothetical protein n=1 Tax=Flavobacterium adhaerens TaxID=3149043 RepID=UPI0032B413F5
MKAIFLFICISFFWNPSITEIRKMYVTAATSESVAKDMAQKLSGVTKDDDKTLVAYKGASIIILAKSEKKISDKTKKFKEGAALLEFAIKTEPNVIETRMIRLSIQENLPAIVNYRGNKKEDKKFIIDHYKEQTSAMKTYIAGFITHSKSFSETEKKMIE